MQVFEALLIDHDVAVNYANWNYFAGIGHDPRNRVFKTVTQGEKYDEEGVLIATWLPELKCLPARLRHRPWVRFDATSKTSGQQQGGQGGTDLPCNATKDLTNADGPVVMDTMAEYGAINYCAPMLDPATQIGVGPKQTAGGGGADKKR